MDPVTHGLIGASASQSFAEDQEKLRWAALAGAAGALLPDLDVLIKSSSDPLLNLEYHRQFTHSFVFIPVGALIVSVLLWWFIKTRLSFKETYLFSLLGITTAGIADTFTSYGVQLLWPLTDMRFTWNLIAIFDPLFSLGIIIAVTIALVKKSPTSARMALIWIGIYLLFAITQKQDAKIAAQNLATRRNHFTDRIIVKPTIGNELVWSIRYVSGDRLFADGVRLIPFSDPKIYTGESAPLIPWRRQYADFQGTVLYRDIERFARLSNGFLVQHPKHPDVIGDGRYSILPTMISPLWGIRVDTTRPNRHVKYVTYREAGPAVQSALLDMILGR